MKRFKQVYVDMGTGEWHTSPNSTSSTINTIVVRKSTQGDTWTIPHNKGTDKLIVTVIVDNHIVHPDEIHIIDNNTVQILFATPVKGRAIINYW